MIDTNIAISGLLWHGSPRQILEFARSRKILLFSSLALLDELERVLARPHLSPRVAATGFSPLHLLVGYHALIHLVQPATVPAIVINDPDDDVVLACAAAANADLIVSGDHHLLDLRSHGGIEIVSASEMLRRTNSRREVT